MHMNETSKPWYKHLWPWLVMLPPLAAVIGGVVTLILAGGPPDLVVDDLDKRAELVPLEADRAGAARND